MAKFSSQSGFPQCSFCGKSRDEVRQLVAGPGAYICNECIELCTEIVHAGAAEVSSEAIAASRPLPDWKVHSPRNPESVELRTLQRQLAQITRQLAAMADDLDGERES